MSDSRRDTFGILWALLLIEVLLLAAVTLYAIGGKSTWSVLAAGGLLTVGTFAIGAFFGLLFGFPHSVQRSTTTEEGKWAVQPNKSFDDITDWLTKILVGVGLTQLAGLPSRLQALGSYVAPMLGGGDTSAGFGVTVVVSSSVIGFMSSFVFTKLILSQDLVALGVSLAGIEAPPTPVIKEAVKRQANKQQLPAEKQQDVATETQNLIQQLRDGDPQGLAPQIGINLEAITARRRFDPSDLDKVINHAIDIVQKPKKATESGSEANLRGH